MGGVESRLQEVRQRIERAATRAGRDPESVEIMAVTKTLDESAVSEAVNAGIRLIGENRVQEAIAKFPEEERDYRLHLIGHLQRNKSKFVPGFFDCVESIDKKETALALERHCREKGKTIDILFEVNTSGEKSKHGFTSQDLLKEATDIVLETEFLHLNGLMTIAPFTDDTDRVRRSFARLRELFEELRGRADEHEFVTLSMGMSSDFEIAVEEGSNRIRVGTVLFGKRA